MRSWNGSVNGVVAATARSTCSSPSTSRRTFMPRSARWASSMAFPLRVRGFGGVKGGDGKGIRRAQVAGRLERGVDLLGGDAGRDQPVLELGHGKQDVVQRQARADR